MTAEADDKPWLAKPDTRRQLLQLCGSKRTRTVAVTRRRWEPGTLRHPETGDLFDTESAWTYIVELLAAGTEVEQMVLDHPPGKAGYVLFGRSGRGQRIYIKLQLVGSKVVGRSFHESDPERKNR